MIKKIENKNLKKQRQEVKKFINKDVKDFSQEEINQLVILIAKKQGIIKQ